MKIFNKFLIIIPKRSHGHSCDRDRLAVLQTSKYVGVNVEGDLECAPKLHTFASSKKQSINILNK